MPSPHDSKPGDFVVRRATHDDLEVGTKEFLFGGRPYADPVMAVALPPRARPVTRTGR